MARLACGATNLARRLGHCPPNQINPPALAREARRLAAGCGLRCSVLDEKQMRRRGLGALLAVGQGSASPPRLIMLRTPGAARRRPVNVGDGHDGAAADSFRRLG